MRTQMRKGILGILAPVFAAALAGCSTTSDSFDCKEGKGLGCKSIGDVNQMVNQGWGETATTINDQPTIVLTGDQSVQRIREEHLRVWVAPYQDDQGNLHESSTVHTVLKPGHWSVKGDM